MKKSLLIVALAVLVLFVPVGAFADSITFNPSANSGSLNVVNINFPAPSAGGAFTITGTTVGNPSYNVYFSSTELLNTSGNGQADLVAQDGKLNFVNIHLDTTYTFLQFYANPVASGCPGQGNCTVGNTVTFTVHATDGVHTGYSITLGNGNNSFSFVASGGVQIVSIDINSTGGFDSLKQPRIGGIEGTNITPEPASLALLGSGLLALGGLVRRRKQ